MKTRMGFVSNSSSSSFVIMLSDLNDYQIDAIENHVEISRSFSRRKLKKANLEDSFEACGEGERWSISCYGNTIQGNTWMDNFNMRAFLKIIGVKEEVIRWTE